MHRERDKEQEKSDWTQFKCLLQTIEQLSSATTCDDVLEILHTAALNLAGSDGVLLVLPNGEQYRYVAGEELIPLLKNPRFPLISCASDWVMHNRQTAVVPDVHTDERIPHEANEPTFVKSLLMVPSGSGKDVIALGSYWIRHHLPDQKEIEIFEALARSTSAALRNIEVQTELRKKEQFYRLAMDAGRIGTWNLHLDTEECVVSPKMAELMGLSPEQSLVPATHWWEAIVPGDRLAVATALTASIEQHVPFEMHFRINLPDGKERWLSSRGGVVRDESGKALVMHGTSIDITERKWLERALMEATEHEQRRIGQELHDGLCQSLAGTSLMVKVLAKSLRAEKNPKANDAEELGDLLLQTADQARQIAHGLHPVELETGGLTAILQRLVTSASRTVQCELRAPEPVFINDREKALHLYRIAQEAVENAIQHAEAQHIVVSLTSTSSEILLEVRDDGHGFTLAEDNLRTSLGLATMHYRASAIGATLSIQSHPGEGTLVQCRLSTKQL